MGKYGSIEKREGEGVDGGRKRWYEFCPKSANQTRRIQEDGQ